VGTEYSSRAVERGRRVASSQPARCIRNRLGRSDFFFRRPIRFPRSTAHVGPCVPRQAQRRDPEGPRRSPFSPTARGTMHGEAASSPSSDGPSSASRNTSSSRTSMPSSPPSSPRLPLAAEARAPNSPPSERQHAAGRPFVPLVDGEPPLLATNPIPGRFILRPPDVRLLLVRSRADRGSVSVARGARRRGRHARQQLIVAERRIRRRTALVDLLKNHVTWVCEAGPVVRVHV
jgi:hypothetical protein